MGPVGGVERRERLWVNESKLPQMRRAVRQVFWNWYYNRSFCPKFDPKANAICRESRGSEEAGTYVGDERVVGEVPLLLGTMYDLKHFAEKDLGETRIVMKTGMNERAMRGLRKYLEEEIYPVLPYRVEVGAEEGRDGWIESERGDPGEGCPGVGEESEVAEFESSMGCLLDTD